MQEPIEFCVRNDEDAGRILHELLREQIKAWVRRGGGNEIRSRQIWACAWEALQNAIRYGSQPGEPIRIVLLTEADGLLIRITQPRPWDRARTDLMDARERLPYDPQPGQLGGLVTISKLASSVEISNHARTIGMRFRTPT